MVKGWEYKRCPECGAYLDPGERCDCQDEPKAPLAWNARLPKIRPKRPATYPAPQLYAV